MDDISYSGETMSFSTCTHSLGTFEILVICLIIFGAGAVLFALIKWGCREPTRKVLLAAGWLILMAGVLDFGLCLSFMLGTLGTPPEPATAAAQAMRWWNFRGLVRFFCLPLISAMVAFMFASLIGNRAGPAGKK